MQCDECGKPANVHEIRVENGMKTERHLCSECAAKAGLTAQEAHVDAPTNPVEMIKQVLAAGPEIEVRAAPECPTCGSTFARFRKMASGLSRLLSSAGSSTAASHPAQSGGRSTRIARAPRASTFRLQITQPIHQNAHSIGTRPSRCHPCRAIRTCSRFARQNPETQRRH